MHIDLLAESISAVKRKPMLTKLGSRPVRWRISDGLVPYEEAVETMEREVAAISEGGDELVWLLEHPPLYTAGTSADAKDLVQPDRFPVFATGRGGEYTYHETSALARRSPLHRLHCRGIS